MKNIFTLAIAVVTFSGCTSTPLPPDTDFGEQPNLSEKDVRVIFEPLLKDPKSADYVISDPKKGYNDDVLLGKGIWWYGWYADINVNAKNSFGGYTGFKHYRIFHEDETWNFRWSGNYLNKCVTPVESGKVSC